jgi:hypothetical protein
MTRTLSSPTASLLNGLAVLFSLQTSSDGGVGNEAGGVSETGKESNSADNCT